MSADAPDTFSAHTFGLGSLTLKTCACRRVFMSTCGVNSTRPGSPRALSTFCIARTRNATAVSFAGAVIPLKDGTSSLTAATICSSVIQTKLSRITGTVHAISSISNVTVICRGDVV
ncbi:MAG: hypothetical protein A3H96_11560 [Acidobacteria bacterium RIFCSPLOWO2_02_FULL_67_36]|nr:MAG: hypothetical protein A3H96_11560 [Acidobacteria bacterium RIFCSPLOWO2_02_FULL_67_36]OFW20841.1 MAG: hypothetical protein A3G21_18810 [Acidobacteria bacterium RIFCSPLOWO2_12_FULL_66_21]